MSMLKWWWRFHAAILPSCGAPRSTRAAPAGPTPSRGSSVLNTRTLSHTHNPRDIAHALALNAGAAVSSARRAAHASALPHLFDALAGKHDRHTAVIHLWRPPRSALQADCFACAREPQPTDTQTLVRCHVCASPREHYPRPPDPQPSPITDSSQCEMLCDTHYQRRRDFPCNDPTIHWVLHGLANKIITNVHEMLYILYARGLRHTIGKILWNHSDGWGKR